jgi:hypothetical protein
MTELYFRGLFDKIFKEMQIQFESYDCRFYEFKTFTYNEITTYFYQIKLLFSKKRMGFLFRLSIGRGGPIEFIISVWIDNNSDYSFVLTDYLAIRPIEFDKTLFYQHIDNYEDMLGVSKKMFKELKKLIATEEMQKLLNTDYEIDVPRDWSPYK